MSRDPRYDILFEPVAIGHLTARNRFYQTPHCNGMGGLRPQAHAAMRGVKAEGGWAVVNTEHCSVHPTSDLAPEVLHTLWDDEDVPALALMAEAVHAHGSLAGVQLAYAAYYNVNRLTRESPMGPEARPVGADDPVQVRAMDKADIRALRGWWRAAAVRAVAAGFDIVNVDANFSTIAFQFLSPRNRRADEYGGPLANRARLLRELIEETREGVAGKAAVSVRVIVDELVGPAGLRVAEDGIGVVALLDELVDLWDIVVGTWEGDSPPSRFAPENSHEHLLVGIKGVARQPVAAVGRFTSPDTMASLVRRGVLDMIGAARPSIADPFLPRKIEEGRIEDIRECIGCNICASSHFAMTHLRCTQNPTMGEEWRRGWHPERIAPKVSDASILVVGAGPAGLECARALGQRGYTVALAEREREAGGRVARESRLPGLAEWRRVRDWRLGQIRKLANVALHPGSDLAARDVLDMGFHHVVLATGARWRRDGVGRATHHPVPFGPGLALATPDDVMDGRMPEAPVVVYDDDRYYMGAVVAEALARRGLAVTIVSPASEISAFGYATLELERTARRLDELGIAMLTHHRLVGGGAGRVELAQVHTDRPRTLEAESLVLVTARLPEDGLYRDLVADPDRLAAAGIRSVARIGDCLAPGAIVHAVYAGHRFARDLEAEPILRRERIALAV
jgi:dimethylamine/trimethylamine dehydrogenase